MMRPGLDVGGGEGVRTRLNALFFFLIFASESNAWVRVAGRSAGLHVAGKASAFSSGNGDPVLFALNALVVCVTLILCFPKTRTIVSVLLNERSLMLLYGYSFLSIAWSANRGNSLRIGIYLVLGLIEFGYVGIYTGTVQQVEWVADTVTLLTLLSVPAQFLLPPSGDPAPGWTGLFLSKNHLGNVCAIGILALAFYPRRWSPLRYAKLLLCGTVLLLSQSFTSILCVLAGGAVLILCRVPKRAKLLIIGVTGSLILFFAVAMPSVVQLALGSAGKNTTLTGRDVIWSFAVMHIKRRPIFGFGYYGFWISEEDSALQYLGWNPNQAHNGYLDLALNEGLIGLALLFALLYVGWRRSRSELRRGDPTGGGTWLLMMLVYLLVHNVSEADFYQRPAWVVYLMAYATVARLRLPVIEVRPAADLEVRGRRSGSPDLHPAPV